MPGNPIRIVAAATLLALACVQPAMAQGKDTARKVVAFGGQMHGVESVCNDYTDDQLREMKRGQKDQAIAMGLSASEFEAIFAVGYEDGRSKILPLSGADRTSTCNKLRAIGGMAPKP